MHSFEADFSWKLLIAANTPWMRTEYQRRRKCCVKDASWHILHHINACVNFEYKLPKCFAIGIQSIRGKLKCFLIISTSFPDRYNGADSHATYKCKASHREGWQKNQNMWGIYDFSKYIADHNLHLEQKLLQWISALPSESYVLYSPGILLRWTRWSSRQRWIPVETMEILQLLWSLVLYVDVAATSAANSTQCWTRIRM